MIHVAAFDDDGVRAHLYDFFCGCFHVADFFYRHASENFGFWNIWRDDRRTLQELRHHKFDPGGVEQLRSAGRFHDRIVDDMLELVRVEKFGDNGRVSAIAEHPDLHRRDFGIVREAIELRAQRRAGRVLHVGYALCVLHGQRCNRGDAVASMRRKNFQIGGSSRSAARIKTGNRQQYRRRQAGTVVSVMSAHDFLLVAPLCLKNSRPKISLMRDWRRNGGEMSPKAQSADTSREGSTGTCECTRLSFVSATKYFVQEPAATKRNAGFAPRNG